MNVRQHLASHLNKDQKAVERAVIRIDLLCESKVVSLPDNDKSRVHYFAGWLKGGKSRRLSGKFVDEARILTLKYIDLLIQPSMEKSLASIKHLEEQIVWHEKWVNACAELLESPERQPSELIDGKPIWEICQEEGLY